ncbi:hypothetical protein VSVS12_03233 [Vibrio scophthalmi]|nr:hypothetical protein VSVS12_03233 [Vibrio scophthalmi]ODS05166.1 hypothetical protein VSF3289_04307 [Vibrio scophthalmi]
MILTFIAATLMAVMVRSDKARMCLIAAMGLYAVADLSPTMQLMFLGVLVATWQSLFTSGERHEKTQTHH